MYLPIQSGAKSILPFQPGIPSFYSGPVLQGATVSFVKMNTGTIVTQLISTQLYSIRYNWIHFLAKFNLSSVIETPGLYTRFQLNNSQRHVLNDSERIHLREDHIAGFWISRGKCRSEYLSNKDYHTVDLYVSLQMLSEYYEEFPDLREITTSDQFAWLTFKNCAILPGMHEVLNEIFYCPFDSQNCQLYYDSKVRKLIGQILFHRFKVKRPKMKLRRSEVYQLNEIRKKLEEYICRKPPSLQFLAQTAGMTPLRLKGGFKHIYHRSIFDYLQSAKMRRAEDLLMTTEIPIKEIGVMVGYPRVSNFITAFRRWFNCTPGTYRRR